MCQVSHWTIFDLKKQHETILTSTLCICKLAIGEFKSEKSYIDYVHVHVHDVQIHVCSPKYEKFGIVVMTDLACLTKFFFLWHMFSIIVPGNI
jgi:hypothetical protein